MTEPHNAAATWVAIARLLRPQGRRGEILADLLTDLDPAVQFAAGRHVHLAKSPQSPAQPAILEAHWLPVGKNAGRIVLQLAGCDSISAAELLANLDVLVPATELPALDPDTFYVADLIGCTLINAADPAGPTPVGLIADVQFAMSPDGKTRLPEAAPLLGLQLPGTAPDDEPILIPFVRAHLVSVDLATKRITMNLPAGLLEDPTD